LICVPLRERDLSRKVLLIIEKIDEPVKRENILGDWEYLTLKNLLSKLL
jgi:hypothetical protein